MTDYPVNMNVKPDVQAFFDEATNTSWTSTTPPAGSPTTTPTS